MYSWFCLFIIKGDSQMADFKVCIKHTNSCYLLAKVQIIFWILFLLTVFMCPLHRFIGIKNSEHWTVCAVKATVIEDFAYYIGVCHGGIITIVNTKWIQEFKLLVEEANKRFNLHKTTATKTQYRNGLRKDCSYNSEVTRSPAINDYF